MLMVALWVLSIRATSRPQRPRHLAVAMHTTQVSAPALTFSGTLSLGNIQYLAPLSSKLLGFRLISLADFVLLLYMVALT